jgi:hypothetical protein
MASPDTMTSVPVHKSTLRLLQQFKTGAQNWDQFLLELVDREMDREDAQYATALLQQYAKGDVLATPLSAVRRPARGKRAR